MPPNSPEEAIAAYLLIECHYWPYEQPLFALPPEKGARILKLLETNIGYGSHYLAEILAENKKWGGGQG